MLIEEVGKLEPIERFLYWVKERHKIFIKKSRGLPPPWTDDEILQNYFFTNCYRENDKVTMWFRENVRGPLQEDPRVVFATICFRWFNYIPTGEILLGEGLEDSSCLLTNWDLEETIYRLGLMKEAGEKVFTGAFNISNSGSRKPKINRVCEDYIQPVWQDLEEILDFCNTMVRGGSSMQCLHRYLMQYPGLRGSGFMAYEIVCDLRYTWVLRDAPDKLTWSNPGPGAKRGLNRLLGRPLDTPVKDWPQQSQKLLAICQKRLGRTMPPFEMREVEHSLCEWDKNERARLQDGHMKRRYNGRG
jgi:hypothetical protein